jgi:hypothetical protein
MRATASVIETAGLAKTYRGGVTRGDTSVEGGADPAGD